MDPFVNSLIVVAVLFVLGIGTILSIVLSLSWLTVYLRRLQLQKLASKAGLYFFPAAGNFLPFIIMEKKVDVIEGEYHSKHVRILQTYYPRIMWTDVYVSEQLVYSSSKISIWGPSVAKILSVLDKYSVSTN